MIRHASQCQDPGPDRQFELVTSDSEANRPAFKLNLTVKSVTRDSEPSASGLLGSSLLVRLAHISQVASGWHSGRRIT